MRTFIPALAVVAALAQVALVAAQAPRPSESELERGVRQAKEGDFDAAVMTLDGVVVKLQEQKANPKDLSRAYTYLAVAYFSLGHTETAKTMFLAALKLDRAIELSAREFPTRILAFFEATKTEALAAQPALAASPVAGAPGSTATPVGPQSGKGKGSNKAILAILGIGAAGGAAALLAGGSKDGSSTSATPTTTPTPVSSLDGNWAGSNISYTVISGTVNALGVTWIPVSPCATSGISVPSSSVGIQTGLMFSYQTSLLTVNGLFASSQTASGTFSATPPSDRGCGTITANWSATKR